MDRRIRDCAILVGYSPEDLCAYSAQIPLGNYWDGVHVWDEIMGVQRLRLAKVHCFLFGSSGGLLQGFESVFDSATGIYKSGWAKHSDGTYREDAA